MIEHRSRERKLEKKRKISDIVRLKEKGEKREGVQNFLLAKRLGANSIQFIFDVPKVSLYFFFIFFYFFFRTRLLPGTVRSL